MIDIYSTFLDYKIKKKHGKRYFIGESIIPFNKYKIDKSDLIAKNPILGFGVGDAKGELSAALESCDAMFWNGERNVPIKNKNYNFHNQFMQTWAEVGIFGFLILLFIMIHPFLFKTSHPLFLIFVGLTFICCITESMFERQAGVVLFAFMYPLLSGIMVLNS